MLQDPNMLLRRAEQALARNAYGEARDAVRQVLRLLPDHPVPLHVLAIAEHHAGQHAAAESAFRRALAGAPRDPDINRNYANLLGDLARYGEALAHYDAALAARPGVADVATDRAETLHRLGRGEEALVALGGIVGRHPAIARPRSVQGTILMDLGRLDAAADAFDGALAIEPGRAIALHGRAWIAAQRGEAGAAARYRSAIAARPSQELRLGLAEALEAAGDAAGLEELEAVVRADPGSIPAQALLARMRFEAGEAERSTRAFTAALQDRPADRALHHAHWAALSAQSRYTDMLAAIDAAAPAIGRDRETALTEAAAACEAGEIERADRALAPFPNDPDAIPIAARLRLRQRDPAAAAALLEAVVARNRNDIAAWAYLGLAWRLLGDPRHDWLDRQPGLWRTQALAIDDARMEELRTVLTGLHRTRHAPQGQSLRTGTQTRGRLFLRQEPAIRFLRDCVAEAVARYVALLPPEDARHPLLAHRNRTFALAGSWSVQLAGGGFHINHMHPEGCVSSALHLDLPDEVADTSARAGWLEIGGAPRELGIAVEPLDLIEPKPGRLVLFPSYLFHGTRPFRAGRRLTVAFDAVPA